MGLYGMPMSHLHRAMGKDGSHVAWCLGFHKGHAATPTLPRPRCHAHAATTRAATRDAPVTSQLVPSCKLDKGPFHLAESGRRQCWLGGCAHAGMGKSPPHAPLGPLALGAANSRYARLSAAHIEVPTCNAHTLHTVASRYHCGSRWVPVNVAMWIGR